MSRSHIPVLTENRFSRAAFTLLGRWGVERKSALLYFWSTASLSASMLAHIVGLVTLAAYLGPIQFGYLAVIGAGSNLALAGCALGAGEVLRRHISRDHAAYPDAFGHALILLLVTGVPLTALTTLILAQQVSITPDRVANAGLIGLVVFSNIVLFAWTSIAEQALLGHDRVKDANVVNLIGGLGRAVAVVVACLGFGVQSFKDYAFWHFGFYVIVSVLCVALVAPLGRPRWTLLRDELGRGASISLSGLMLMLRRNADVLVVSAVASPAAVGIYAVATRIVSTASVVTASLDRLIYSSLVRAGAHGPAATLAAARRYAPYAAGLCLVTAGSLIVAAPAIRLIFGAQYAPAMSLVQAMAATLFLTSFHWLAADALTAAERHTERLAVELTTGVAGFFFMLILAMTYGVTGVVIALYASGIMVVVGLWGLLFKTGRSPCSIYRLGR